jgi:hypothetical protein
MSRVIWYTCRQELWPELEAAVASHGYTIDIPLQQSGSGASAMLMREGMVSLLLTHQPASELFNIEIWGEARDTAIQMLEALLIRLSRPVGPCGADGIVTRT